MARARCRPLTGFHDQRDLSGRRTSSTRPRPGAPALPASHARPGRARRRPPSPSTPGRPGRPLSRSSSPGETGEDVDTTPMQSPGRSARGFTNCMSPLNHDAPAAVRSSFSGLAIVSIAHCRALCHGGRMDTPDTPESGAAEPGPDAERPVVVDYTGDWPGRAASLIAALQDQLGARAARIEHIGSTAIARHGGQGCARSADQRDQPRRRRPRVRPAARLRSASGRTPLRTRPRSRPGAGKTTGNGGPSACAARRGARQVAT